MLHVLVIVDRFCKIETKLIRTRLHDLYQKNGMKYKKN